MNEHYTRIISDLKNRIYKGVYFLHGDEPYYIDLICDYIEDNILEEAEKSFNQVVLYGEETEISLVIDTARRFPMMSNHHVVIVKEAQNLKNIELLNAYLEHPLKSTILVINYKFKKLDKRTSLYKALSKSPDAELFISEKLRDYQVPSWIDTYFKQNGISADRNVSMIMTEYLGTDLSKIVNELSKLKIMLPEGKLHLTAKDIEEKIGISKDFNNFELQNAIGTKNIAKSNLIVNHFGHNQKDNPITVTISTLFSFFRKLLIFHFLQDKSRNNVASVLKINPYFVSEYELASRNYNPEKTVRVISLLREFDLKSKGYGSVSAEPGELLKELVFKILH
ncbi:MAG: DNA polymerase III subunit delta [Marinilabiliaceae bacterium]|jgi:DNA polymerase-3 subunit delta|nr:DNA polymerase III subunit delta [Marinilabiliaceae bacterium]